jgi:hypothetical protein
LRAVQSGCTFPRVLANAKDSALPGRRTPLSMIGITRKVSFKDIRTKLKLNWKNISKSPIPNLAKILSKVLESLHLQKKIEQFYRRRAEMQGHYNLSLREIRWEL